MTFNGWTQPTRLGSGASTGSASSAVPRASSLGLRKSSGKTHSEPGRQRLLQPLRGSVADPDDMSIGADQHRGRRSDLAQHWKLPLAVVSRVDGWNPI